MWVALLSVMANNNDNKSQQGGPGKPMQPKGAPTAGNRDSDDRGKMPADPSPVGNDQQDVDVGDDRSPQRAPQPGTAKPTKR